MRAVKVETSVVSVVELKRLYSNGDNGTKTKFATEEYRQVVFFYVLQDENHDFLKTP